MPGTYIFKPCRFLYRGRQGAKRILIVVHDMEVPEGAETAEHLGDLFESARSPRASWHFAVDKNSVVQGVSVGDTAWHAPGANHDGIGIEHAGYARQTRGEWLADTEMLNYSAGLAASIIHGLELFPGIHIPVRQLTPGEIANPTVCGFVGHRDINAVFHKSSHTDPGTSFPWDVYLPKVDYCLALARAQGAGFHIPFR